MSDWITEGPDWNRDGKVGPVEGFLGRPASFGRDVLINVLASLIAAALSVAVVYLVGVLAGWFALSVAGYLTAACAVMALLVWVGVQAFALSSCNVQGGWSRLCDDSV